MAGSELSIAGRGVYGRKWTITERGLYGRKWPLYTGSGLTLRQKHDGHRLRLPLPTDTQTLTGYIPHLAHQFGPDTLKTDTDCMDTSFKLGPSKTAA